MWTTCSCQQLIYKEDLHKNFFVCPNCTTHHKISCRDRFNIFFDNKEEYKILETPSPPDNPLNFVDTKKYTERLSAARKLTGQDDSVMVASGKLGGINITVGAQNFSFIGGSVGAASGEAFIYAVQHAIDNNNPFVLEDDQNEMVWNGRNEYGDKVANGAYFCRLSLNGQIYWAKLAVVN